MNRSHTYTLTMSGVIILTLAAQSMFLAPHLQASVLYSLTRWQIDVLGVAFYLLAMFLIASIFLNYSRPAQAWVFLYTAVALSAICVALYLRGLVAESALMIGLALAFLLSNWLKMERDWLVEAIQWVNLYVGIGLLLRPDYFLAVRPYRLFQPETVRYSFVVVLLVSTAISLLLNWKPTLGKSRQGQFLALPWVLWGLMMFIPLQLPNAIATLGVSTALIFGIYIPWEKLVLREFVAIGRRFFRLVIVAQFITLALLLWLMRLVELNLSLSLPQLIQIREISFVGFSVLILFSVLVIATVNMSVNGVLSGLSGNKVLLGRTQPVHLWGQLRARLLEPFTLTHNLLSEQLASTPEYEEMLEQQMDRERRHLAQLNLLRQINSELESLLTPEAAARLTANSISNTLGGDLTAILQFDPEHEELVVLASSGPLVGLIPQGYRQSVQRGIIGRAVRQRRTQLALDTRLDPDYFQLEDQHSLSELVVPLLYQNQIQGVIVTDQPALNAFDESDVRTLETVAIRLITAWERSEHDQRLTSLVNAGITLSTTLDVEAVIQEIAEIAQKTLDARFVFVALVEKSSTSTRTAQAGYAPHLLNHLNSNPGLNPLIQTAINYGGPLSLNDLLKRFPDIPIDGRELRNFLSVPVRLRTSSIGAILAFGKQDHTPFSSSDISLASQLSTQASAAVETTWLYQELRSTFTTTHYLYELSTKVIEAEKLTTAAASIAEVAYQLSTAKAAGIILMTEKQELEARIQVDATGIQPGVQHPMDLVEDVMESGQSIIRVEAGEMVRVCLPLKTPRRQYGALWVEVSEKNWNSKRFSDNLNTLANQAAIALERSILLAETRKQAAKIESAYRKLEVTYDQTLIALSSALDARDRETEGHSLRVSRVATALAQRMGFSEEQAKVMERGALLHDIGKIGISDAVLLKPGKLDEDEWQIMRQHPDIGAHIIEGIPFLQEALPVIRYHQERWDGSGYPMGLKGNAIPLMARIFGVVDAFDALTSNRPYRTPISMEEAVEYLQSQAGSAFDPAIVKEFSEMAADGTLTSLI